MSSYKLDKIKHKFVIKFSHCYCVSLFMGPSEHMSSYVESESMRQWRKEIICGGLNKNVLDILILFSNWSQFYGTVWEKL